MNNSPNTAREAEILIETIGHRGDGIGHLDGRPAFIAGALPGERVRARLTNASEEGHSGHIIEILTPDPARVTPPCPHFNDCGGCSLQHWSDEAYRNWTQSRVEHLLDRAGVTVKKWLPAQFIPAHTRRRASFTAQLTNGTLAIGYHRERSHQLTPINDCLVLSPRLQTALDKLRAHLAPLLQPDSPVTIAVQDTGSALDIVITGPLGASGTPRAADKTAIAAFAATCGFARISWRARDRDDPQILINLAPVIKTSGRLSVPLPPGAFLQPSREGEDALIAAVTAPLKKRKPKKIADLFAGCGTFTGPLLDYAPVLAVETDGPAIRALQDAARTANTLTVEKRNLFTEPLSWQELKPYDTVIFDPPRAGAQAQSAALANSKIATIIAISCNPSTFARDAALLQQGGYKLETIQLIDQFTWSAHVEIVALFTR